MIEKLKSEDIVSETQKMKCVRCSSEEITSKYDHNKRLIGYVCKCGYYYGICSDCEFPTYFISIERKTKCIGCDWSLP